MEVTDCSRVVVVGACPTVVGGVVVVVDDHAASRKRPRPTAAAEAEAVQFLHVDICEEGKMKMQ